VRNLGVTQAGLLITLCMTLWTTHPTQPGAEVNPQLDSLLARLRTGELKYSSACRPRHVRCVGDLEPARVAGRRSQPVFRPPAAAALVVERDRARDHHDRPSPASARLADSRLVGQVASTDRPSGTKRRQPGGVAGQRHRVLGLLLGAVPQPRVERAAGSPDASPHREPSGRALSGLGGIPVPSVVRAQYDVVVNRRREHSITV
jgi:hypothetical protein